MQKTATEKRFSPEAGLDDGFGPIGVGFQERLRLPIQFGAPLPGRMFDLTLSANQSGTSAVIFVAVLLEPVGVNQPNNIVVWVGENCLLECIFGHESTLAKGRFPWPATQRQY